jgi:hypothetical protein
MAAFAGPLIAIDPALTARGWIGAVLIFSANTYLALPKKDAVRESPKAN